MTPNMANPKGTPANLLRGGKPGNRGGRGAIPSKIRARAREGFAQALDYAIEIAKGSGARESGEAACPTFAEQLRAVDLLGKYGLGQLQSVSVESSEIARIALRLIPQVFPGATAEQMEQFGDLLVTECYNLAASDIEDPEGEEPEN